MYEAYYGVIQKSGIVNDIDINDFDKFLQEMNVNIKDYKSKQHIFEPGQKATEYGIILNGQISIYSDRNNGHRLLMSVLDPGFITGSIEIVSGMEEFSLSYIARGNCQIMFIQTEKLLSIEPNQFISRTQLNLNLAKVIASAGVKVLIERYATNARSVREKIANYIYCYLAKGEDNITINFTTDEWADFLFIPKTSLLRELNNMKKDGIIEIENKTIKITNIDSFKNMFVALFPE